jgi:hypothetical protein
MAEKENKDKTRSTTGIVRTGDFVDRYANHVALESSAWDLNMLFGTLDQTTGPDSVRHHTAMHLSWAQAKLMAFFLQANIMFHEAANGKISIPEAAMPPAVDPADPIWSFPDAQAMMDKLAKLREEL